MRIRKKHTAKFKSRVVREALKERKTTVELAAEFAVNPAMISQWKKIALDNFHQMFEGKQRKERVCKNGYDTDSLLTQIGKLTVECDWLKKNAGA
jgi:transposase